MGRAGVAIEDRWPISGQLNLIIKRRGRIIEVYQDKNLVVNIPRQELALAIAQGGAIAAVTQVAVGSNGTAPAPGDTAITTPFTKPVLAVTRPTPTQVQFDFVILESDANDLVIREFGLLRSDGKLFARRTRGAIEKAIDLEIDGQWIISV